MSSAVLESLGETSLQFVVLAAVVAIVQVAFARQLTPRWRYGLWLLVLARLAVPAVPGVEVQRFETPHPARTSEAANLVSKPATPFLPRIDSSAPASIERDSVDVEGLALDRVASRSGEESSTTGVAGVIERPALELFRTGAPSETTTQGWDRADAFFGVWCLGVSLGLFWLLQRAWSLRRRIAAAAPVQDARFAATLVRARERTGIHSEVRVVRIEGLEGPCVAGLGRPVLLWPAQLEQRLDDDQLLRVLLHELAHIRHGDVRLAFVLQLITTVHWFNPFAWLVQRCVRSAQESVRDWEALSRRPSDRPSAYARTLLAVVDGAASLRAVETSPCPNFLDGGRDLERRIRQIHDFERAHTAAPYLGLGSLFLVGAIGFLRPELVVVPAVSKGPAAPSQSARIEVERTEAEPAWWGALQARLDSPVTMSVEPKPITEVIEGLRAMAAVDIVVHRAVVDDYGDPEVRLNAHELPLRYVLDQICMQSGDFEWAPVDGAVYLFEQGQVLAADLRFYDVEELLESADDPDNAPDDIVSMVMEFSSLDDFDLWDREHVSIVSLGRILAVHQTPRMHARIETVLEHLLTRVPEAMSEIEPWEERMAESLAVEFSPNFEAAPVNEIVAFLEQITEETIWVDEDHAEEEVTLQLGTTTVSQALAWVARYLDLSIRIEAGAIRLSEAPPRVELRFHELKPLFEAASEHDPDDLIDYLDCTIRDQIDIELWDSTPSAGIRSWSGALLVTAPPETHERIASLIAALVRAYR